MINMNRDYFNNIVPPDYILCKANRERIGILNCTEKTLDVKFNDINEISFKINLYIDENTKNPYYEAVEVMKYILVPDIGFFCISSVDAASQGTKEESKTVVGKEYQCHLAQRYLEVFAINTGETGSVGDKETGYVTFYNMMNKERSLLHLVLEKFPEWSIGHVDPSLVSQQRSFEEITRQDVYSFLTTDVAEAFGCVFIFNTLNNTINAYEESTLGLDTDLHVSYNNLLKNTSVSCSTDDIKTCLTLYGQDNMDIREINMGFDRIYNFDYYNSTDFWSKDLYDAYNNWVELRNSYISEYNSLQEQLEQYIVTKNNLENEKASLIEQYTRYNNDRSMYRALGYNKESNENYGTKWLPIVNLIGEKEIMEDREALCGGALGGHYKTIVNAISVLEGKIASIEAQKDEIANLLSMEKQDGFTESQYKELCAFIREDELSTNYFLITDAMSEEDKIKERHDLLNYGEKELAKVSVPQLSFKADMVNLFAIPEFQNFTGNFDVGNYIWVSLRDDYSVKARLLSVHINFHDLTDFSVEFGNVTRKAKNVYTDITDAIKIAQSAATSVSFNSSNWNKANKTSAAIDQMISDGLLSAGAALKSGEDAEMIIDRRGIYVNTTTGDYIGDSIYIGNGRILFTQDNWLTVGEAIGRVDINGESVFGVIAKAVLAGDVIGSTITGGNIYGANIAVGGKNNESGVLTVFDGNTPPNPLVTLDKRGITLAENVSISWDNISNADKHVTQITKGTVTTSYINALDVTAGSVACENLTGGKITGKRFVGIDENEFEFVGINCSENNGWAIYAGEELEEPVEPYKDQRVFNIGHNGEMYANRGLFRNLRIEDRCAGNIENDDVITGIDFIYSNGNSTPIHTGTIYQDSSAFRFNSDNNIELNATNGKSDDDCNINIYGNNILLGGTVNAEHTINHKKSADFYIKDDKDSDEKWILRGALFADEDGMHIESRNDSDLNNPDSNSLNLNLKSVSGYINYFGTLQQNSSQRYKKNITNITDELADKILELAAKEYDYTATGKHSYGFIAEETDKILPQVVGYDSQGRPDSIAYIELIPLLIKTVQKLNDRITNLENR